MSPWWLRSFVVELNFGLLKWYWPSENWQVADFNEEPTEADNTELAKWHGCRTLRRTKASRSCSTGCRGMTRRNWASRMMPREV